LLDERSGEKINSVSVVILVPCDKVIKTESGIIKTISTFGIFQEINQSYSIAYAMFNPKKLTLLGSSKYILEYCLLPFG
jgi:hypothetical protein